MRMSKPPVGEKQPFNTDRLGNSVKKKRQNVNTRVFGVIFSLVCGCASGHV